MSMFRRKTKSLHPDTIRLDFAEAQAKREGFMPVDISLRQHLDASMKRYYANRENTTKSTD